MKISKLDFDSLSEEDKFNLIMHGIRDISEDEPSDNTKSDLITVLGCSPVPLRARVLKMMSLVKRGFSNTVLLSGGGGWQKLYRKIDPQTGEEVINEAKKEELLRAIVKTISGDILGDNPSEKEVELYRRFVEAMKEMGQTDHVMSYEERQEKKKLRLTEAEFMNMIIITNGGLKGVKYLREPFSDNTKENMEYTKALLKSQLKAQGLEKLRRIIIVTSSFHCRRAYLTFKKQFPEVEVIVCPATQDLQDANVSLGTGMLDSSYYKTQISRECNAIINYSKNGSIADLDLEEFLPEEIAKKIEENQNIRRASNKQDEI